MMTKEVKPPAPDTTDIEGVWVHLEYWVGDKYFHEKVQVLGPNPGEGVVARYAADLYLRGVNAQSVIREGGTFD